MVMPTFIADCEALFVSTDSPDQRITALAAFGPLELYHTVAVT